MAYLRQTPFHFPRKAALASAAVAALVVAGAIGELSGTQAAADDLTTKTDQNAQAAPSFAPLIAHVKPAVVSVKVKIVDSSAGPRWDRSSGNFDSLPPEIQRFLKQFGGAGALGGGASQPAVLAEGSGFFVSSDGYIVTNNHVVQNAKTVTVVTDDGKTLDAKVVGTDPKTDLAVVKVDQKGDYPYVSFASGTPRIGDWVVAIGNPYGLGGTATAGIISAEGRDIGDGPYDRFLQIDAPINKGNSGGPTFNMQGQVVGVNTAIYSPTGGSIGIGFDIPAATVQNVVASLEHNGYVSRGYLGVEVQPVTQAIADSLGLKAAKGALVDGTMPNTPAAAAGLKSGDVITKINGQDVADAADLTSRIGAMKPGDKIEFAYLRNGAEKTADATLASQSNEKVAAASDNSAPSSTTLGLALAPESQVAGGGDKGVAVVAVDPNGAAAEKGVTAGDVILDVQGHAVSTPADVTSDMAAAQKDGRKAVLMRIQTANGDRFVAFPFG
jgi:serine protease Do